jgi:hypothetical protein
MAEPALTEGAPGASEDAILAFLDQHENLATGVPETEQEAAQQVEALRAAAEAGPKERPAETAQEAGERLKELASQEGERLAEETEKEGETLQGTDEYEAALAALRRYKTPSAVLDKMSPAEVIQWGQHVAKIQGDTDKAYTDLRELKKSRTEEPTSQKPREEATTTEATPGPDLSETTAKLTELLGLDAKDGQVLEKAFEAVTAPLRRELESRDRRDQARDNALTELLLDGTRRRLQERFPQLGDDGKFETVKQQTMKQMASGGYDNLADAMMDAARIALFDDASATQSSNAQAEARARGRAAPAVPSPRTPPAALSLDERLDKTLEMLDSGASQDEARAAAGW